MPSPLATPPAASETIVPVNKGDAAPFTGLLYPQTVALRWRASILDLQTQIKVNQEADDSKCQIKLNLAQTEYKSLLDAEAARTEGYRQQVSVLQQPKPFYENPWFTFGAGIVFSALATGFIVYEVKKL